MENKNIKAFIVPIVAVAVFTIALFGAGYAYFSSQVNMNTANYALTLPSTTSLVCTKQDCNVTITPDMMTNTNTSNTTPKATSNCSLSCTCSGTEGAACSYDVYLNESGTAYTPSTGLGTDKEFTARITTQAGCTVQNSSNTETQINTLRGNVVANCTLTVPAGGSVTSNVSAEFKWYNLNIDQSIHALKEYNYQLTNDSGNGSEEVDVPFNSQTGTGTIYRNSYDSADLGDNISVLTNGYETNKNNISKDYYLKHTVENNIITESYACVKYTEGGILKEVCVQGGDESYYGTYDGMSSTEVENITGATGNIKKIQSVQQYTTSDPDGYCYYTSTFSVCNNSSWTFDSYSSGYVNAYSYNGHCHVFYDGISYCESW